MIPLIEAKRAELVDLCLRHRVRTLELFGSAARNRSDPEASDLDFLVEFPDDHVGSYFDLLFALEDLFDRKCDLVETAAIRNPYFLRAIAEDRVVLYADRSPEIPVRHPAGFSGGGPVHGGEDPRGL